MRMSDWSSDVCSADLRRIAPRLHEPTGPYHRLDAVLAHRHAAGFESLDGQRLDVAGADHREHHVIRLGARTAHALAVEDHPAALRRAGVNGEDQPRRHAPRSEEHTSELQSLMRISYAVFCLKKTHNKQTSNLKSTV